MKTFSLSIYFLFLYIIVVSSGSSEGIFQNYEYSLKATKKGGTVIGAHNANYSVIISYPPAAEDDTSQVIKIKPPIAILSPMVGLSYVGITADCAYLKNKMFEEISNSQYVFGSPLIGKRLASNIAARIHRQTLEIHLRPFGVKLCIACIDEIAGPQVFEVDGLGSMHSCRITCLGPLAEEFMSALNEQISRMKAHGDIDLATPSEFSISSTLEKMPVGELVSCLLHSLSNALRGADSESKAYHSLEPATIAIVGREMPFHIIDSDILQILRQKLSGIEVETKEKFSLEKYLQTLH